MINLSQLSYYTPLQQQNYTSTQTQNSSLAQSSIFDSLFNTVQPAIVAQQDNSGSLNLLLTLILKLLLNKQQTATTQTSSQNNTDDTITANKIKTANISTVSKDLKQIRKNSTASAVGDTHQKAVEDYFADAKKNGSYNMTKHALMDQTGKTASVERNEINKDTTNYVLQSDVFKPDLTNVSSMVNMLADSNISYSFLEKFTARQAVSGVQDTASNNQSTVNKNTIVECINRIVDNGWIDVASGEKELNKHTAYSKDTGVTNIKNDRFLLENFDTLDNWYNNSEGGVSRQGFVATKVSFSTNKNEVLLKILNDKYNMNLSESDASLILSDRTKLTTAQKTRFDELNKNFLSSQDNFQSTIEVGNLDNKLNIYQVDPDDGTDDTKSNTSDDYIVKTIKK